MRVVVLERHLVRVRPWIRMWLLLGCQVQFISSFAHVLSLFSSSFFLLSSSAPFLLLLVSSLRRVRRSLQTGSLNRDRSGRAGKANEPKTYEDCSLRTRQDLYYRSPLGLVLVCWSPEAFSLSAPNAADARKC